MLPEAPGVSRGPAAEVEAAPADPVPLAAPAPTTELGDTALEEQQGEDEYLHYMSGSSSIGLSVSPRVITLLCFCRAEVTPPACRSIRTTVTRTHPWETWIDRGLLPIIAPSLAVGKDDGLT